MSIAGDAILKEPWTASCALIVFPGGADLGYCHTLNGEGNRRIGQYVSRGGCYLGFCAGAYYGSGYCDFERGNKKLEVVGDRELAFFPGTCRGLAFNGFVYGSERGAKAAKLDVDQGQFSKGKTPQSLRAYYNGGGVFVDAPKFKDRGVDILASFPEKLHVDSGEGSAAVIHCTVDQGAAILSCIHPEYAICPEILRNHNLTLKRFAAVNLDKDSPVPHYAEMVKILAEDDEKRSDFLTACLLKLGLQVNEENKTVPSLSRLHLSTTSTPDLVKLMESLREVISIHDGEEYLKDENDTFHFEKPSAWAFGALTNSLPGAIKKETNEASSNDIRDIDYNAVVKRIIVHDSEPPLSKETPYFNHDAYYVNLKHYLAQEGEQSVVFGKHLLYGDVVTSTNTMLEKCTNFTLSRSQKLT